MRERPAGAEPGITWWAAVLAIAATYFYFLLFAEFAFLELAANVSTTSESLRMLMLGLGAGGVIGAGLGAWRYRATNGSRLLAWAFRGCAVSAALALGATSFAALFVAGIAVGLSLGGLTVVLASSLRAATRGRRLGLCIGAGTGLAYAGCNLPWIFRAPAATQTVLAGIVVGAASYIPRYMVTAPWITVASKPDRSGALVRWLAILLALVWMDSAAFYIIQHSAALRDQTWQGTGALLANASIHLGAALVAGAMLDRGWRGVLAVISVLALALACLILNGTIATGYPAGWFYTAGVSLYSTVLVEYPARDARPWVAAVVFAIAGWLGSALGIGMAQDLATVPIAFVVVALGVVAAALLWRTRAMGRAAAIVAMFGCVCILRGDDEVAVGRGVYIAEGCIHCHSQYVRPNSPLDVQRWGPAMPLRETLAAEPPLFGSRRLGPDLSQVGNRRSAEWNRLHLIAPQAVSPGSRMPSYAHLFRAGDPRGEALVAYLASLGAESMVERWKQVAAWRPQQAVVISSERAAALFRRLCAPCHGDSGHGDGAVAAKLSLRPPDWAQIPWRHVPPNTLEPAREVGLSRIIKFGLPGLPMAGHEYLPDAEIVGLARFVQTLHKADGGGPTAAVQP